MKRRVSPLVADSLVAGGLFLLSVNALSDFTTLAVADVYTREADWLAVALIALQTLPLALRRRYPVPVAVVVVLGFLLDRGLDYPSTFAGAATVVAIHAIGSELPRDRSARVGLTIVVGVALYTVLGALLYESVGLDDVLFVLATGLLALFLGREVHSRREQARGLQARVEAAEREREERARVAVATERARIARELHDVVAHQMVVMTLQAQGASRLAADADPRIVEALETISRTGQEGMAEMRRMVQVLRTDGEDADPLGPGPPSLAPQPGLDDLPALAQRFGAAGLAVSVELVGDPRALAGGIDLGAYRIVEESLTNALKHAGPQAGVQVRLDYQPDCLDILVSDDGRGLVSVAGGGHGVLGMRERAVLLGGRLDAGARPGGGFQVHATIPVGAPA